MGRGEEGGREVLLRVKDLHVGHGGSAVAGPFSFQLRGGDFWALTGRNGSGKSTFLKTVLGFVPQVFGTFDVLAPLAYVPQRSEVDESVPARVTDLVSEGSFRGWSFLRPRQSEAQRTSIEWAMRRMDVLTLRKRRYADLSEGQKQRVLIARALASRPRLLILDEPTSAMDLAAEEHVLSLLEELCNEGKVGILMVSHHLDGILKAATHHLALESGTCLVCTPKNTTDDAKDDPDAKGARP